MKGYSDSIVSNNAIGIDRFWRKCAVRTLTKFGTLLRLAAVRLLRTSQWRQRRKSVFFC